MTTTTERPVSKTAVRRHTNEIRRSAAVVQGVVDSLDLLRKQPTYHLGGDGDTLAQTLARSPKGRELIHRYLGEIEGTAALLRELLDLDD